MTRLRRIMWDRVGLVRDAKGLRGALGALDALGDHCRFDTHLEAKG